MNLIGTALERSDENRYFVEFKKRCMEKNDYVEKISDSYEWKCWMLKKYFRQNIISEIIKLFIGILLLILAGSSRIFKLFGNSGASTVFVVGLLVVGVILCGTGVMFSFSNYRCLKNFRDFVWDEDEEENEIVSKIINFYSKK